MAVAEERCAEVCLGPVIGVRAEGLIAELLLGELSERWPTVTLKPEEFAGGGCDLALVDATRDPGGAVRLVREALVPAVVFGQPLTPFAVRQALDAGARAALVDPALSELVDAAERVLAGERVLGPIARRWLAESDAAGKPSPSQVKVLDRLSRGEGYESVAIDLGCNVGTVSSHVRRMERKWGVRGKDRVLEAARRYGWVP